MGILKVEDGSIDIENLEDEGLSRTLLTATRLNPKMTCHLSNEQIVSADSIIRESIGTVAPHKEERDDESYGLFLHSSQLNEDDPGEDQLASFIMTIANSRHLELEEFWFSHAGDWLHMLLQHCYRLLHQLQLRDNFLKLQESKTNHGHGYIQRK